MMEMIAMNHNVNNCVWCAISVRYDDDELCVEYLEGATIRMK